MENKEIILKVLKRYNFKIVKKIQPSSVYRFNNLIVKNSKDEKFFIKILLKKNNIWKRSLLRESLILKFFTKHPELKVKVPLFFDSNFKTFPYYHIHRYIEGDIIGYFYDLYNHKSVIKMIPLIIENLKNIQQSSSELKEYLKKIDIHTEYRTYKRYYNRIKEYEQDLINKNLGINFDKIYRFYQKINKKINFKLVFSHGDFTFANHILGKNKVIYLTDWEWIRFDNLVGDLCHLWIQSFRYPSFQRVLLEEFLKVNSKKSEIKLLFRFTIIERALNEIRWNSEICKKEYKPLIIKYSLYIIDQALKGTI